MSGPSGPGDQPPVNPAPDCEIVERTQVNSPKTAVVMRIQVNDELRVRLATENGQKLLIVETGDGGLLGSLTPRHLPELIRCIQSGHRYLAVVLRVLGGLVEVEVRPKS